MAVKRKTCKGCIYLAPRRIPGAIEYTCQRNGGQVLCTWTRQMVAQMAEADLCPVPVADCHRTEPEDEP